MTYLHFTVSDISKMIMFYLKFHFAELSSNFYRYLYWCSCWNWNIDV